MKMNNKEQEKNKNKCNKQIKKETEGMTIMQNQLNIHQDIHLLFVIKFMMIIIEIKIMRMIKSLITISVITIIIILSFLPVVAKEQKPVSRSCLLQDMAPRQPVFLAEVRKKRELS